MTSAATYRSRGISAARHDPLMALGYPLTRSIDMSSEISAGTPGLATVIIPDVNVMRGWHSYRSGESAGSSLTDVWAAPNIVSTSRISIVRFHRFPTAAGAAIILAVAAAACSGSGGDDTAFSTPDATGNLFRNASFEEGSDPWYSLADDPSADFQLTDDLAHTGTMSAHLHMDDPASASGDKVYYLIQDVDPEEFPEYLEGYYRVENWDHQTTRQYLQFVVIALNPNNFPSFASNYQIRYILAGIDSPPFEIGNAHFQFLTREEPVQGEWVHFSTNLREDFQRLWNAVPSGYTSLRILFEVRWDKKSSNDGAPRADAYYDDLYVGDKR